MTAAFVGLPQFGDSASLILFNLCVLAWMFPGVASIFLFARWLGSPLSRRKLIDIDESSRLFLIGVIGGPAIFIATVMVGAAYSLALYTGYITPAPQPIDRRRRRKGPPGRL